MVGNQILKKYGHLAHDCPMSLKTKLSYVISNWEIGAMLQHGLADYPYTQLRIGTSYSIDILNRE